MGKRITDETLWNFVRKLKSKNGFEEEMPLPELENEIRGYFGMSPLTVRNYKDVLQRRGFIEIGNNFIVKIRDRVTTIPAGSVIPTP